MTTFTLILNTIIALLLEAQILVIRFEIKKFREENTRTDERVRTCEMRQKYEFDEKEG